MWRKTCKPGTIHHVTSGEHELDIGGVGPHSQFSQTSISSSSSRLGLSTSLLVETPYAEDNSTRQCLNLLVDGPRPPYIYSMFLIIMMNASRPFPFFFFFLCYTSASCIFVNEIEEWKTGTRLQLWSKGIFKAATSYLSIQCQPRYQGNEANTVHTARHEAQSCEVIAILRVWLPK